MGIDHVLILLIGVLLGAILMRGLIFSKSGTGTLKIDSSNPEKDLYRFEIDKLEDLETKSQIIVAIDRTADLSQE